jgi:uncharacterized protein (TIGR02594 family)
MGNYLKIIRNWLGEKEVKGKGINPRFKKAFQKVGTWVTDDDTPWCGIMVAVFLQEAGYTFVKGFERALNWATYGEATNKQVGAIVVFSRKGGGHVGIIVDISKDGNTLYVAGGNQDDAVTIRAFSINKYPPVAYRKPKGADLSAMAKEYTPIKATITGSKKVINKVV